MPTDPPTAADEAAARAVLPESSSAWCGCWEDDLRDVFKDTLESVVRDIAWLLTTTRQQATRAERERIALWHEERAADLTHENVEHATTDYAKRKTWLLAQEHRAHAEAIRRDVPASVFRGLLQSARGETTELPAALRRDPATEDVDG